MKEINAFKRRCRIGDLMHALRERRLANISIVDVKDLRR